MAACVAYKCPNRSSKRISFHAFPKNPERRRVWETALRRENFRATQFSKICADHFEEQYFDRTGQTTRLREHAVPTIFDFPPHLIKKKKYRKPPADRGRSELSGPHPSSKQSKNKDAEPDEGKKQGKQPTDPPPSSQQSPNGNTGLGDPGSSRLDKGSEHSYAVISPLKMRKKLEIQHDALVNNRKKMKLLQSRNRRLQKKVTALSRIVQCLQSKVWMSDSSVEMLERTMSGVSLQLLNRLLKPPANRVRRCGCVCVCEKEREKVREQEKEEEKEGEKVENSDSEGPCLSDQHELQMDP